MKRIVALIVVALSVMVLSACGTTTSISPDEKRTVSVLNDIHKANQTSVQQHLPEAKQMHKQFVKTCGTELRSATRKNPDLSVYYVNAQDYMLNGTLIRDARKYMKTALEQIKTVRIVNSDLSTLVRTILANYQIVTDAPYQQMTAKQLCQDLKTKTRQYSNGNKEAFSQYAGNLGVNYPPRNATGSFSTLFGNWMQTGGLSADMSKQLSKGHLLAGYRLDKPTPQTLINPRQRADLSLDALVYTVKLPAGMSKAERNTLIDQQLK